MVGAPLPVDSQVDVILQQRLAMAQAYFSAQRTEHASLQTALRSSE
jgi:hypothetical protein